MTANIFFYFQRKLTSFQCLFRSMIAACVCLLSIILADVAAQRVGNSSAKAISKRQTQTLCDRGWFLFEDKCYRTGGTNEMRLTWEKASAHCKELSGTLASLHSQAQSDFIRAFISMNLQETAWIGLNDRGKESEYEWDDGTKFEFKNWEPHEPSGPSLDKEDCVEFLFHSGRTKGKSGQWNDIDCEQTKEFICQKPGRTQGKRYRDPRFCTSNRGWKLKTSCYFAVDRRMTWQEAEDYCIGEYEGHLATINDFSVNVFLEYVMRNYTEDMWIGMKMKKGFQQQWSSEWFVAFTDWLEEPEDFMPDTCAARTFDKWVVLPCNRRLPFICETSTKTVPKMAFPEGMSCPDEHAGWRDVGGNYCYHVIPEHLKWFEANFRCLRIGGTLASFHSKIELDVLQPFLMANYLKSRFYSWIGLLRQKQNDEEFAWIDGTPYDLNRWSNTEPNSDKEECAELNPISLQWYDHFCDQGRPSICSVPKISTNKTTIMPTIDGPTASCINGFSTDVFISVTSSSLLVAVLLSIVVCYFCARGNRCGRWRNAPLHPRLNSKRESRQKSEYEYDLPIKPLHFPPESLVSKHKSDYEVAIDDVYDTYEIAR